MSAQNTTLSGLSAIQAVTIRLRPKEDLKGCLDEFATKNQIKAACIITCVGSLERAAIRFANKPNAIILDDKFEIVSLNGTIAESGSHLHLLISDATGKTIGGHLKEGSMVFTTAEIVLGILPDVEYLREVDEAYGYKELAVNQVPTRK